MPNTKIFVGGWGKYLDATIVVEDCATAMALGRLWSEEAIGKVVGGLYVETIELGVK
jgi:hypothetical protein